LIYTIFPEEVHLKMWFGETALQRWIFTRGSLLLSVVAVDYGALAIALRNAATPVLVLTGVSSPFAVGYPWISVPLLLLGYLLVPALVGAVVVIMVQRQIDQLLLHRAEAQRIIKTLVGEVEERMTPTGRENKPNEDLA